MRLLVKIYDNQPENSREFLRQYYANYHKKFETDSGLDLVFPCDYTIPPHKMTPIHLGICCAPVSTQPQGYYLYPRSSLAKTSLRLANSVGIIDYSYRGELIACVDNISDDIVTISQKDMVKLFQVCSPDLTPLSFELVDSLDMTARGEGGYGSTDGKGGFTQ